MDKTIIEANLRAIQSSVDSVRKELREKKPEESKVYEISFAFDRTFFNKEDHDVVMSFLPEKQKFDELKFAEQVKLVKSGDTRVLLSHVKIVLFYLIGLGYTVKLDELDSFSPFVMIKRPLSSQGTSTQQDN